MAPPRGEGGTEGQLGVYRTAVDYGRNANLLRAYGRMTRELVFPTGSTGVSETMDADRQLERAPWRCRISRMGDVFGTRRGGDRRGEGEGKENENRSRGETHF